MGTIFVCTAAFNETDLLQTINSCLSKAKYPENITFGISLQYPNNELPNLSKYPNVRYVILENRNPLGTSTSRAIAAALRRDEQYFLSIDAHTLFKNDWDDILITELNNLKTICNKPIITTYAPFWYKDKDGNLTNQNGSLDLNTEMPIMSLRFKTELDFKEGEYVLATPTWDSAVIDRYKEHYLLSAHFLFADMLFLEEVPFDSNLYYYEENTAALRAWTRGYRMFAINKDVLWTREMFRGQDVKNSWRSKSHIIDNNEYSFYEKILNGTIRCKNILLGNILGIFGAPTKEDIERYEQASGFNYKDMYNNMYIDKNINTQATTTIKLMYFKENDNK